MNRLTSTGSPPSRRVNTVSRHAGQFIREAWDATLLDECKVDDIVNHGGSGPNLWYLVRWYG